MYYYIYEFYTNHKDKSRMIFGNTQYICKIIYVKSYRILRP